MGLCPSTSGTPRVGVERAVRVLFHCRRVQCFRYGRLRRDQFAFLLGAAQWGIAFQLSVRPPPTTREGMTNTDLSAWYEPGGEVWHPVRDAWERYVKNRGETQFSLRMPVLEQPMYIQWDTPGGTVLVWKTVATLRETLFSNPDWVWEAEVPEWAEYEAILAADRICWAHWTGADPYELFPMPVDAGDGTTVEITDGMIAWVVEEVCQQ